MKTQTMRKPRFGANKAAAFFWDHAGFNYGPDQTPEQGRKACALKLADAEEWARQQGIRFEWGLDDETDASFRKTDNPYRLWVCVAWTPNNPDRPDVWTVAGSTGGVDFGAVGKPATDNYARVVEAEIALEAWNEAKRLAD